MSRKITTVIIHASATQSHQDIGAAEIDKMHRARGFAKIGYHYVIRRDGTVETGRKLDEVGAHAVGWNTNSIGICLIGGADKYGRGEANYTPEQMAALDGLLSGIRKNFQVAVIGHRDTGAKKDCPSFDVKHWLETGELINPRNLK